MVRQDRAPPLRQPTVRGVSYSRGEHFIITGLQNTKLPKTLPTAPLTDIQTDPPPDQSIYLR